MEKEFGLNGCEIGELDGGKKEGKTMGSCMYYAWLDTGTKQWDSFTPNYPISLPERCLRKNNIDILMQKIDELITKIDELKRRIN